MSSCIQLDQSTLCRWSQRAGRGQSVVERPGPKKREPLKLTELQADLALLNYGRKRVGGSGALIEAYRAAISRRDVQALIRLEQKRLDKESREKTQRYSWLSPGLVWAIDDCHLGPYHLNNVMDLASTWRAVPEVGDALLSGEDVAQRLEGLFERYGPPLMLKRDNGSNLNSEAVQGVLERFGVLPLNSPAYYPKYNGAVERSQGIMKESFSSSHDEVMMPRIELDLCCREVVSDLNVTGKRVLSGHTPLEIFGSRTAVMRPFTPGKRKEVYNWITTRASDMMQEMSTDHERKSFSHMYRIAAEQWLVDGGHVVRKMGKSANRFSSAKIS